MRPEIFKFWKMSTTSPLIISKSGYAIQGEYFQNFVQEFISAQKLGRPRSQNEEFHTWVGAPTLLFVCLFKHDGATADQKQKRGYVPHFVLLCFVRFLCSVVDRKLAVILVIEFFQCIHNLFWRTPDMNYFFRTVCRHRNTSLTSPRDLSEHRG